MSNIIIKAENISKSFVISHETKARYNSLGESVSEYAKKLLGKGKEAPASRTTEEFWALKDINFEINKGDRVGIIGRNGAGKSTLLKVLSRITEPTSGRIQINGRVASLLEVGTGFHPELTGRENIFLNGAILGMSRAEIRSKFDEIVAFAEVEKFLDTPVKRYSSGMYVRLAFAVAAHLEPEVLIVDEVLAVGDAQFQKKCLGKMQDVSKNEGRTVLFVSHNMAAVRSLCTQSIVLKMGRIVFSGSHLEGINHYQSNEQSKSSFSHSGDLQNAPGNDKIRILSFEVSSLGNEIISISSGFSFELTFYNYSENVNLDVTFELRNLDEIVVFHHGVVLSSRKNSKKGLYRIKGTLPAFFINAGIYKFHLIFGESQRYVLFHTTDLIQFEIINESAGSNSSIVPGLLRYEIPYQTEFVEQ